MLELALPLRERFQAGNGRSRALSNRWSFAMNSGTQSAPGGSLPRPTSIRRALAAASSPACSYFVVWLFAVLMAIHAKSSILPYRLLGSLLGRSEMPETDRSDPTGSYLFSFLERLSFFRSDLLWGFIILPLIGGFILYWIPRRWRMGLVVTATFLVIAFLTLELRGYRTVGRFQSWRLWLTSIRWGWLHFDDALRYTGPFLLLKLWAILVGLALLGFYLTKSGMASDRRERLVRGFAFICLVLAIVVSALASCTQIPSTPFHRSVWSLGFRAFCGFGDINVSKYDSLGLAETLTKWREITASPTPKLAADHFGAAKDCDLICFVLETAPARCLDMNETIDDLPNLKRLSDRSWVTAQHVTTYPQTKYALFSILTSWYPSDIFGGDWQQRAAPGLMRNLGQSGYTTAAYLPGILEAEDENLHRAVGISKLVYGQIDSGQIAALAQSKPWKRKIALDRSALEKLKDDVSEWIKEDRRYAVLYLPQIGHAPWPDVAEGGTNSDIVARGRAVIALQDQWLGEILTLLERAGRLENTLIMVTGDHGIRSAQEDPAFSGASIDPYSFHVPCLLFAPKAVPQTVVIPWMTSHIDLTPSVLDLLGVAEGRSFELGSPMWDPRLDHRTTFFWANQYLGADGFQENGQYYMWQSMSDTFYHNTVFDFRDAKPQSSESDTGKYILEKIGDVMALQHRIMQLGSSAK
jgi:hypothetical protein